MDAVLDPAHFGNVAQQDGPARAFLAGHGGGHHLVGSLFTVHNAQFVGQPVGAGFEQAADRAPAEHAELLTFLDPRQQSKVAPGGWVGVDDAQIVVEGEDALLNRFENQLQLTCLASNLLDQFQALNGAAEL